MLEVFSKIHVNNTHSKAQIQYHKIENSLLDVLQLEVLEHSMTNTQ